MARVGAAMTDAELMGMLGLLGLSPMPATPGDPRGGFLEGQPDQLQKLPAGGEHGHGGEFVVNAAATARFRPLLEAINRAVPPPAGVQPERARAGRTYFGGGESGEAGVGVGEGGDDSGVGGVGGAGTGGIGGDPGAEGMTPGMSLSDAHSATVSDALSGALSGVVGSVTGGIAGTAPDAVATALGMALGLSGLGPVRAPAAAAAVGAANAQTAAMSGLTGLTAGEISNAMAAENTAAADAAAGTGLGPGGQGGADEPAEAREARGTPPASLSLRDYLAWLRSATTIPVRGAPASTPFGTFAVPVYHAGGVVQAPRRRLREAMILAEPGEFVVRAAPARTYRTLLAAINANDPAQIQRQARTLRERLTR